jgi:metallophosphoesterase superfamily enzyme
VARHSLSRACPALIIHTGDITHLSKPAEFDQAQQLFTRLRTTEMHTVPGEHDTTDATVTEYFNRFGKASDNKNGAAYHSSSRLHTIVTAPPAFTRAIRLAAGAIYSLNWQQH